MIRSVTTTILAAFVLVGTALGQSPVGSQGPPATLPAPTDSTQPTPTTTPPPTLSVTLPTMPTLPTATQAPPPAIAVDAPCGGVQNYSVWGDVSYMLGWAQGGHLPSLVTTDPANTPRSTAGVLPNATVLFGASAPNQQSRSGIQGDLGYWFDPNHQAAIEAGFFVLDARDTTFNATSNGSTILARPYIDSTTSTPASSLIAYPGLSAGSVRVSDDSHQIWSANVDLRENFYTGTYWRLDSLLGYRFIQLNELLTIQESVQPLAAPFVKGTTINSTDSFGTGNIFNGVDLGIRGTFTYDAFTLELTGKISAGHISEQLTINGSQVVTVPGSSPVTSQGGLLALGSNMGSHGTHTFTVVPEIGVILNWQLNQYTNVRLGYNALWLLDVIRPGLEVDTTINPNLIPPTTSGLVLNEHPQVLSNTTYVLVQGITFGVEFRY